MLGYGLYETKWAHVMWRHWDTAGVLTVMFMPPKSRHWDTAGTWTGIVVFLHVAVIGHDRHLKRHATPFDSPGIWQVYQQSSPRHQVVSVGHVPVGKSLSWAAKWWYWDIAHMQAGVPIPSTWWGWDRTSVLLARPHHHVPALTMLPDPKINKYMWWKLKPIYTKESCVKLVVQILGPHLSAFLLGRYLGWNPVSIFKVSAARIIVLNSHRDHIPDILHIRYLHYDS